jgi:flagellar biosynthetic protein FliR
VQLSLPEVAGEQLVAFVLVMSRVGPLFVLAPVFSARAIPYQARLVVASALSLALVPIATRDGAPLPDGIEVFGYTLKETLVGLGFAFSLSAIVAAVQLGAGLLDTIVGFSYAGVIDPFSAIQGGILGQLYGIFVAIVLVVTGGDQLIVAGLAHTYEVVPLTAAPGFDNLAQLAVDGFGTVFVLGLEVVAPVLVSLVVVDAALALVSRAAPQLNVFVLGLPVKILVALVVVTASLPFVASDLRGELENTVAQTLVTLTPHG